MIWVDSGRRTVEIFSRIGVYEWLTRAGPFSLARMAVIAIRTAVTVSPGEGSRSKDCLSMYLTELEEQLIACSAEMSQGYL